MYELYSLDPSSGVIKTRQVLDRETRDHYTVVVVAQDLGRPPQLTSRLLIINVTDTDDNDPVFVRNPVSMNKIYLYSKSKL